MPFLREGIQRSPAARILSYRYSVVDLALSLITMKFSGERYAQIRCAYRCIRRESGLPGGELSAIFGFKLRFLLVRKVDSFNA